MSTPLPTSPPAGGRELSVLARKWAYLVSTTSYIPLPHKEIERQLLVMTHELYETVATEPLDADRAAAVGERLVKLNCVGRTSLRASIDVLAGGFLADERLRHLSGLGERVARTLGALADGYADTMRWYTLEQQDGLNQALLAAVRHAEQSLRNREAQHDEVIDELSLLRSQLSHQLLHDVLTALPNRQFFTTRLEHALSMGGSTSVYHLEVDGMATFCAGLGRQAAAAVLRTVADRLTAALAGEGAMVARFTGGRFGILVESTTPAPDPAAVVEAIGAALTEPARVHGLAVELSASIGVVQSPPHGKDPGAVLDAANLALRKAKHLGPGRFAVLEPGRENSQEPRLAATLPNAWRAGQVHVAFRPQVRLTDGLPVRVDARLRWDHAELGSLPHERCVSLAERTGLGVRLGRWLFGRAGERLQSWRGDLPLTVAVPPSQATDPELLASVQRSGMPVERVQVSVPAGLAAGPAAGNLTRLAEAGVAVAVHDFGGAAGDVTCLSDVPVQAVRLAPGLVRRSAERITGRAVRDMVALAHEAGAAVVVDGISTSAEADWWRDTHADLATGPLFQHPKGFPPLTEA
jgi:diguanylate cyclase (GGDEF)-like protein